MSVDLTRALGLPELSSMFIHDLQRIAELAEGCERIVELGCYWGRSTRAILDSSEARIWCVDSWNLPKDKHERGVGDADFERFLETVSDSRDRVTILRMTTREAAGLLPEESFDLVVIDADHACKAVAFDIIHYSPLLAWGGILCGHDYRPGDGFASKAVDGLLADPQVLKGGVVWWAEKREGWLKVEAHILRQRVYYYEAATN